LALDVAEGAAVLAAASVGGRLVAAAPDTVLGAGLQQARQGVDTGAIGRPVAATAFVMSRGHEYWHPHPAFYYQVGGGPLLDMGPYYLTALVTLLGPIASVTAEASRAYAERTILSEPKRGQVMPVEIDTHTTAILRFAQGTLATTIFSFDIAAGANLPRIEIYGTEGTLVVPDPNTFGGDVLLRRRDEKDFVVLPSAHTHRTQRGTGVADLAHHLYAGSPFRARGDVAQHVLEAMQACATSAATGQRVTL
jgi:predicted dehydrogenase